jgi:putative tricarboxylic transport membrane protein
VNRALGVSLTMVAIVWLWLVRSYIPDVPTEGEPGPRAFPFLLGVILAILGAALALSPPGDSPAGPDDPSAPGPARRTRVALTTFTLLIAYAFLLDKAGFIASTIALMVVLMAGVLGLRRWGMIGGLAVAFTVGCWAVFVSLLGVPLPGGSWMP